MSYHSPVLLTESIEGLSINPEGIYVDVTFGGGGHSRKIMEHLSENGRLYAFDQDSDALANSIDDSRFTLIHENFKHLKSFLRLEGVRKIDGLLADLGVSSHQFDEGGRGFSIRFDAALDLRMDQRQKRTARDVVNGESEGRLKEILSLYGEIPNAGRMANAIATARNQKTIDTTFDLCRAVEKHIPRNQENKFLAMLFQALRIEVNDEMGALREMLLAAKDLLKPGGRIAILTYHSLEDRIVKNFLRSGNLEGKIEKDFYGNILSPFKVIEKGLTASEEEVERNPRARSAKLRVAEKL